MENLQRRVSTKEQPVKSADGTHGRDIGTLGLGTEIIVDLAREGDDQYVPVVGPGDLGPTWKRTGLQGWVKLTRSTPIAEGQFRYLAIISTDGKPISFTRIG